MSDVSRLDAVELQTAVSGFTAAELQAIRRDFPILSRRVRADRPLVYLDSAATSQKPLPVIAALNHFYEWENAAVHRGAHQLAEEATAAYESARQTVADFIGADNGEVVWTANATAGVNLLAYAMSNATAGRGGAEAARFALHPGDEIVVTAAEHHANLVPWQELCSRTGAVLRWIDVDDDGRLRVDQLDEVVTDRTRVLAFTHTSNVTGAVTPVAPFVAAAERVGALTVLDASQSAPHMPLRVRELGIDFMVFTGHKVLGPTGVGVLYGRRELLEALPAVTTGGSMVEVVTMQSATYAPPPQRFEAGTQMVAAVVGLGAAVTYLTGLGLDRVQRHEQDLTSALLDVVARVPGVRVVGPTDVVDRVATVSLVVDGVHAHDAGQLLDDRGVAVRVGHHCAQPLHRRFGVASTLRASCHVYTTAAEIEIFGETLSQIRPYFTGSSR